MRTLSGLIGDVFAYIWAHPVLLVVGGLLVVAAAVAAYRSLPKD